MEALMNANTMAALANVPAGTPAAGGAAGAIATTEPKGALNHFCQRYCRRPVTKEDIVYTSAKYGKVYQATVTLNCIEGQQFVGEVAPVLKDAEKNAAQQALIYFEPVVDQLPPVQGQNKNKKRKTPSDNMAFDAGEPAAKKAMLEGGTTLSGENPALTPKVLLNTICMKLLKRPMQKGEVLYETHNTARGFQSTVRLPCLPGEMGELAWAGEVASQQKQAEQNAAAQALEAVNNGMSDLQAQLPAASAPTQRKDHSGSKGGSWGGKGGGWGKGGWGKGYGKGGWGWGGWGGCGGWGGYGPPGCGGFYNGWDGYEGFEGDGMEGGGFGGELEGGMMGMGGMGGAMGGMDGPGGGRGMKGGKAGGEDAASPAASRPNPAHKEPRTRVTKVAVTGEVLEWRGRYGWIKAHAEIQHAAAKKHGGKIFISKSDFADPNLHLEMGTVLQFHVYEDPNGLGAEEVQAF